MQRRRVVKLDHKARCRHGTTILPCLRHTSRDRQRCVTAGAVASDSLLVSEPGPGGAADELPQLFMWAVLRGHAALMVRQVLRCFTGTRDQGAGRLRAVDSGPMTVPSWRTTLARRGCRGIAFYDKKTREFVLPVVVPVRFDDHARRACTAPGTSPEA